MIDHTSPRRAGARSRTRDMACLVLLSSVLAGCPPESTSSPVTTTGTCDLEVAIGQVTEAGFVPFADGDEAGVVLGFQGFRFIDAAVRLEGVTLDHATLKIRSTIEGHSPLTTALVAPLTAAGSGAIAEHVQLFFNDIPMAEMLGRDCKLEVQATAADCTGTGVVTVTLAEGGCMPDADAGAFDAGAFEDGGGPCADAGL